MMLIILDKDPFKAAHRIPTKIRHKQLLELMQMLSCVVGFGYAKSPNGKEIKNWISRHKLWTYFYCITLFTLFKKEAKNVKEETYIKYKCLIDLIKCKSTQEQYIEPTTSILRYKLGYKCAYATNTELPIEQCVKIYEDYVHWKGWE